MDKVHSEVIIAHEEIPGFMAAMTMPFHVKDDWAVKVFAPGQEVRATLVIVGGVTWIENPVITESSGGTNSRIAQSADPPQGIEIPDFSLTDQDARRIHLHQYRGKALLITFIYTRCPLPDYCIRMSSNFSEILKAVEKNSLLHDKVRLLSVSFDPEFDNPGVLREYARVYLENQWSQGLRVWQFVSGSSEEIRAITRFFGLQYSRESGQIVHSLRTALVGPDSRLVRLYSGNEWTPFQVMDEFLKLRFDNSKTNANK